MCDRVACYPHQGYLSQLPKHELYYREAAYKKRLIKQAGFCSLKTFDGCCFDDLRPPGELTVFALKEASFVDERKSFILYSDVDTGKPHLATAIGIEACSRGKTVWFFHTGAVGN